MKKTKVLFLIIILVVVVSFVAFSLYNSTYRGMALSRTSLSEIDSITKFSGEPQTLVLGSDESGNKKAVWFSRNKEIQGTAYLKDMISEEEARATALDNEMVEEDLSIELRYFEKTTDVIGRIGPYWVARDHGDIMIFIDAYTGKIALLDMGPVNFP